MMKHPMRRYREERGITLATLAARSGVAKGTLSKIENGLRDPSLSLIRRIIDATDGALSADDFLGAICASPSEGA
jgi:transcriptional regulator with XRE-family HTH domain